MWNKRHIMESTPKRKNAKIWPKTTKQLWRHVIRCRNVNKSFWRSNCLSKTHKINKPSNQQGAAPSRAEPNKATDHKVNRVGCLTSVSHKRKHVTVNGRGFLAQKFNKFNPQRTLSPKKESLIISNKKRIDTKPDLVPPKTSPSRPGGSNK